MLVTVVGDVLGMRRDVRKLTTGQSAIITLVFLLIYPSQGYAEEPDFAEPIANITVPAGRDVKLACTVVKLGSHKVAWIHFERSAILTVQNHVITRNPRISVSHDRHKTWFLHIRGVQETDEGKYMCQINTATARTQVGYVRVVVPPSIDDGQSSSDVIVREQSNVSLVCGASGSPEPVVKWKREDGQKININRSYSVMEYEGETMNLTKVSRLDMGAYLCIAANGVPPIVSKRINLSVDFPPMLRIPHQLVGAPLGDTVTLECFTESHPTSLNYWAQNNGSMIHTSPKFRAKNIIQNPAYKTHMRLTIFHLEPNDYGTYKCIAKNPRGETDGTIRLYTSPPPSTTPASTTTPKEISNYIQDHLWDALKNMTTYKKPSSLTGTLGSKDINNDVNQYGKTDGSKEKSGTVGVQQEWPKADSSDSSRRSVSHCLIFLLITYAINILWCGGGSKLCQR